MGSNFGKIGLILSEFLALECGKLYDKKDSNGFSEILTF